MAKRPTNGSDGGDEGPPRDGSNMPKAVELRMDAIWAALILLFRDGFNIELTPDVSFGWALFKASKSTAKPIEVWRSSSSKDGQRTHVFLNACVTQDVDVVHLMCRAAVIVSLAEKHTRREFEDRAKKIGFDFPFTEAMKDGKKVTVVSKVPVADDKLSAKLQLIADANPFPGIGIDPTSWAEQGRKATQTTRMLAGRCKVVDRVDGKDEPCGFTIRIAAIWAKKKPCCPMHPNTPLSIEWGKDGPPEDVAVQTTPKPVTGEGGAAAAPEPSVQTQDNTQEKAADAAD